VSGTENGTQKATREWFVEEVDPYENEEAWIHGGIGIEGDSGAAIVEAETNSLVGQLWGRNAYWGPGHRITYFTPIADIFDDVQEKCGQQSRPQLPQHRDESERYAAYPSCRQCYDLRTYLDSRRSSRLSLQSMIMGEHVTPEGLSELLTPGDAPRFLGIEEAASSLNNVLELSHMNGHSPALPIVADLKSPYATTLDAEDLEDVAAAEPRRSLKRAAPEAGARMFLIDNTIEAPKRHKSGH
jgi:hypothetical protein